MHFLALFDLPTMKVENNTDKELIPQETECAGNSYLFSQCLSHSIYCDFWENTTQIIKKVFLPISGRY